MAKTGTQLAGQMLRKQYPEDIEKGFRNLGYSLDDIDKQYGYHKNELIDPDNPEEIDDARVYSYMRDHLRHGGILPNPDESFDNFRMRLGRHPTNDEYKTWIKPKIARSYKEFTDSGYDRNHIRSELMDAYGYKDLVDEAMGSTEDDDWFDEMKTKTAFPKGVFVPQLDSWDKLRDELSYLSPQEKYAFLRAVAKNHVGK